MIRKMVMRQEERNQKRGRKEENAAEDMEVGGTERCLQVAYFLTLQERDSN